MASLTVLPKQNYRRATWKNGLGHTDEIAIYPAGSELRKGDFLWRISSARIEQGSPFSVFPNHDRVLVVIKGEGIHLTHTFEGDEDSVDVPPLAPYEFPGDVPSRCELTSGPITDLSIFIRKAEAEAMTDEVEVDEGETYPWVPSGRWNFAFAAKGNFEVVSPGVAGLKKFNEGDTVQVELTQPMSDGQAFQIRPVGGSSGHLVLISLQG